ncbi:Uncharacterised protein [Vibrio cholerae]|nr:Uncharacterised protein [Vibrio cholerae]
MWNETTHRHRQIVKPVSFSGDFLVFDARFFNPFSGDGQFIKGALSGEFGFGVIVSIHMAKIEPTDGVDRT